MTLAVTSFCILPAFCAGISLQPQKITQGERNGRIRPLAFSPGGDTISSSFSDGMVTVWTPYGRIVKELRVSERPILNISYESPTTLVSALDNGMVVRSDILTGQTTVCLQITQPIAQGSVKFSPAGTSVLAALSNGRAELWDLPSGKLKDTIRTGATRNEMLDFNGNDRFIMFGGPHNYGTRLALLDKSGKTIAIHEGIADYAVAAPDGSETAVAYPRSITLLSREFTVLFSTTIQFSAGSFYDTTPIPAFSPDGKTLAVLSPGADELFFFSTESQFRQTRVSLPCKGDASFGAAPNIVFSRDSKKTAIAAFCETGRSEKQEGTITTANATSEPKLIVVEVSGRSPVQVGEARNDMPWGFAFSPNTPAFITNHRSPILRLWDLSGPVHKTFKSVSGGNGIPGFSSDGNNILFGSWDGTILMSKDGTVRSTFTSNSFPISAISPDGSLAAYYAGAQPDRRAVVQIRDTSNGKLTGEALLDHTPLYIRFDRTGKRLLFASGIWNIQKGGWDFKFPRQASCDYAPKADIAVCTRDGELKAYSMSGVTLSSAEVSGLSDYPSIAVSPDGTSSALLLDSGDILLWDMAHKVPLDTMPHDSKNLSAMSFSPDGKYLAATGVTGTVDIWKLSNRQMFSFAAAGGEWLVYTPDGYFDASPHGGELAAIVKGVEAFGIDQFAARYNRPDLILERMGTGTPEQITHYYEQYRKRLKKLGLSETDFNSDLHVPGVNIDSVEREEKFVTVKFTASDSKYPLKSYSVYINNVPSTPPGGVRMTGKSFSATERLELTPGRNKIEISALNSAGAESFRALAYADYAGKEKGDLYYLALGTSKYKDPSLNLDYADKDAQDLKTVLSKMTEGFEKIHTKVLLNSEVTFESIAKAKSFLEGTKTGDTVILFVAGHGGYSKGKDAEYYYLPYDADQSKLETTGIKFEEIENLLSGIKARKKLFLLDTCESGELEESIYGQYYAMAGARGIKPRATRKPAGKRGISANVRPYLYERDRFIYNNLARRTGAIVFSSSKGGEISYESADIANGFFTEEVLRALTDREADKNGDRQISTDELREYVSQRVAENTGGLQHPTVDRDNIYQKIDIPSLAY